MEIYNKRIANDNGNGEHKIIINGAFYRYPNTYKALHNVRQDIDETVESAIHKLEDRIEVEITSKALQKEVGTKRYFIGKVAVQTGGSGSTTMNIRNVKKHEEDLPIVNTLGIVAVDAVKEHYQKVGNLQDAETIEVVCDMSTALPVYIFSEEAEKFFAERFMNHVHQVRVYVANITVNVKITFRYVRVLREGIPALFNIIENGQKKYRSDSMFDKFKEEYEKPDVTGKYFTEKRMLHVDIGSGTTELVYTTGYKPNIDMSTGEEFGIGQAIENSIPVLKKKLTGVKLHRQIVGEYLRDKNADFHAVAQECLVGPKQQTANELFDLIENHVQNIGYQVDVISVYGGGSILLNDVLYNMLVEYYKNTPKKIEVLWIPEEFAVEMNARGLEIYNEAKMDDLIKSLAVEEVAASKE
ncbi:hypothetical protein COA01_23250 [Bacillus cereus]|uniref:ParM/StbA family protein n=1 Tax=Bacillus cereus TaxID=1396 RepID=UPI000BFDC62D|nr:ParM/StbA family protein [Bacillus cereus]PGP18662.1 hypothetical protein COA01_23250 [Bacillus cereus]